MCSHCSIYFGQTYQKVVSIRHLQFAAMKIWCFKIIRNKNNFGDLTSLFSLTPPHLSHFVRFLAITSEFPESTLSKSQQLFYSFINIFFNFIEFFLCFICFINSSTFISSCFFSLRIICLTLINCTPIVRELTSIVSSKTNSNTAFEHILKGRKEDGVLCKNQKL